MKTLQELQSVGCIPYNVGERKNWKAVTVSEFVNFSAEEKESVQAVVLDNSIWVATENRESPSRSNAVYSYDGKHIGFFNRQNFKFSINEIKDNSLLAIKILNIKEGQNMAEVTMGNAFEEALNQAQSEPKKMDFGGNAPKAPKSEQEKAADKARKEAERARKEQELANEANKIKHIGEVANTNFQIDPKFIDNNQKRGRLLGFFVNSDPVVKISLKQTPVNTGTEAAPKYQLRPGVSLTPEQNAKFANGTKKIENKFMECNTDVTFKESAPSGIVAGIVVTPLMTEITHESELDGKRTWTGECATDTAMSMRVLSKEALYAFLELNYNKKIKEDESIPNHTTLIVRSSLVKSKNAKPMGSSAEKPTYRTRITAEGRQLLVQGNFFPLHTYKTITLSGATAEEKQLANNNFSALMKQFEASKVAKKDGTMPVPKGEFSAEAKETFHIVQDKCDPSKGLYVCESSIVDANARITCKPFGAKANSEMTIDVVALPARVAKESKDGTTVRYVYDKIGYKEGALTDPKYADFQQRVLAAAGTSDFTVIADKAAAQKRVSRTGSSTGTKVAADRVSGLEMLSARANTNAKFDNAMSLAEIFESFNNAGI
mgnify:CR=1 FL=1